MRGDKCGVMSEWGAVSPVGTLRFQPSGAIPFLPGWATSRVHFPRTLLGCEHGWGSRLAAFFNLEYDDSPTLSLLDPDTQRVNPTE